MSTVFRMDPRSSGVDGGRRPLKPGHPGTDPPFVLGGLGHLRPWFKIHPNSFKSPSTFLPDFFQFPMTLTPGLPVQASPDERTGGRTAFSPCSLRLGSSRRPWGGNISGVNEKKVHLPVPSPCRVSGIGWSWSFRSRVLRRTAHVGRGGTLAVGEFCRRGSEPVTRKTRN